MSKFKRGVLLGLLTLGCARQGFSDPCMDIASFTTQLESIRGWKSHYRFFTQLEGCRDGMYAIQLERLAVEFLSTEWESVWKLGYFEKDSAYYNMTLSGVAAAREDEQDGGPEVKIPLACPAGAPALCGEFLRQTAR